MNEQTPNEGGLEQKARELKEAERKGFHQGMAFSANAGDLNHAITYLEDALLTQDAGRIQESVEHHPQAHFAYESLKLMFERGEVLSVHCETMQQRIEERWKAYLVLHQKAQDYLAGRGK